jgi:hypothetical protein
MSNEFSFFLFSGFLKVSNETDKFYNLFKIAEKSEKRKKNILPLLHTFSTPASLVFPHQLCYQIFYKLDIKLAANYSQIMAISHVFK